MADDFKGFTCVSGALQAGEGGGEAGPVLRAGPEAPHVSQNLPVTLVHAELGLGRLGDEIRTCRLEGTLLRVGPGPEPPGLQTRTREFTII